MISVVVATRDRPGHLDRCLWGLALQEEAEEFEVVVADDGSRPETEALLAAWRGKAPYPLFHAWEENRGFRLARARNRGIGASRGEYLIFIDGDCIPPSRFVSAHERARRDRSFLAGARRILDRAATERLPPGRGGVELLRRAVPPAERLRLSGRDLGDRVYRLLRWKDRPKPLGANLSAWRRDLLEVNGFDERFVGWGLEDEDLARRLSRLGLEKRFAPPAARVAHQWHEADPTFRGRAAASDNAGRFHRGFFLTRCRMGILARPLSDLRARVEGAPGLAAAFPRRAPDHEPAEVEIRAPHSGEFDPRSEVRIALTGGGPPSPPGRGPAIEVGGNPHEPGGVEEILKALEALL